MKLFILRPKKNEHDENSPWNPWYDKCFGFVIQANDAGEARKIADENAKDEKKNDFTNGKEDVWMSEELSSCEELVVKESDAPGVIMSDVWSA